MIVNRLIAVLTVDPLSFRLTRLLTPALSRVYIACDACDEWYHAECVGMTSQQAAAHNDTYMCPRCVDRRAAKQPSSVDATSDASAGGKTIYQTPLDAETRLKLIRLVDVMKVS